MRVLMKSFGTCVKSRLVQSGCAPSNINWRAWIIDIWCWDLRLWGFEALKRRGESAVFDIKWRKLDFGYPKSSKMLDQNVLGTINFYLRDRKSNVSYD